MQLNIYLSNRLKEVLIDGKWVAFTNFKEQITAVDYKTATGTIGNHNSIALLTFHINYYLEGLIPVFSGGSLDIRDKYSFDMPPITDEADWQALVARFLHNAEQFIALTAAMSNEKMEQPFVEEKYGFWLRNIEGVIEHCYYHLGQVSLIRKLLGNKPD